MKKYTVNFINLDSQESNTIYFDAVNIKEAKEMAQFYKRRNYSRKFLTSVKPCKN